MKPSIQIILAASAAVAATSIGAPITAQTNADWAAALRDQMSVVLNHADTAA